MEDNINDKIPNGWNGAARTDGTSNSSTDEFDSDDGATSAAPIGDGLGAEIDADKMIERLWLKAEASRWAGERKRLLEKNAVSLAPHDFDFRMKAKALGFFLWILDDRCIRTATSDDFDMIAACYEALAEAVALAQFLLQRTSSQPQEIESSLGLIAEAQSALRFAVAEVSDYNDGDQMLLYRTLREIADERRIFLAKGMKLNDSVDPSEWAAIAGSVHALQQEFVERERAERRTTNLLNKLSHKASELLTAVNQEPDGWKGLVPVVEELVAYGVQPSRIEIRKALLPIVDQLPSQTEASKAFGLVLREIKRYRANSIPSKEESRPDVPSEDVQTVAKLLKGKSLLLIGAVERRKAAKAIEKAFGLKSVEWISTSEHDSYRNFEPYVARSDVAAVILLIRWASHSFGEIKAVCDRHNKPLIRLTGGYNPNQIAAALLKQASVRLGKK